MSRTYPKPDKRVVNGELDPLRIVDGQARRRLHQVARYLAAYWPAPFPVRLRICRMDRPDDGIGDTYRPAGANHLVIRIHSGLQTAYAIDTLLHEWAHAATWPASVRHQELLERVQGHHDATWKAVHGDILEAWEDGDADMDSFDW